MILRSSPTKLPNNNFSVIPQRRKGMKDQRCFSNKLLDGTWPQFLWTDEKLFTVQAIHINSQNDRIWIESFESLKYSVPFERQTSFRRKKPALVMVWAGVTSTNLKTPLIFIEAGVKINQHAYLMMLKGKVVPWLRKLLEIKELPFIRTEQPLTQPDWSRTGAKTISICFGPKNYGLHFLLI